MFFERNQMPLHKDFKIIFGASMAAAKEDSQDLVGGGSSYMSVPDLYLLNLGEYLCFVLIIKKKFNDSQFYLLKLRLNQRRGFKSLGRNISGYL